MICTVIPTFNNAELVSVLLSQLKELPEFDQLSITVVDNGSSDGTSALLEENFPFAHRIRLPENRGGSGGFIAGVNYAMTLNPEYIWMLDDDAEVKEDTLSELLSAAKKLDEKVAPWGAIGSMMANLNEPEQVTETGAWLDWKHCCFRAHDKQRRIEEVSREVKPVEYCAAASLLTRPDVVEQVGFFENVFIHYDDVDWCLRLTESGLPVYCAPASVIWHPSLKNAPVTWVRYYDARNFIWLCRRHNRKWVLWGVFHMLIKGAYFYLHRMRGIGRLYFLGVRDAFSGHLRMRSELEVESLLDAETLESCFDGQAVAAVFYSRIQADRFRESNPGLYGRIQPLFMYEPDHLTGSTSLKTKLHKLFTLIRSFLYMLFHPGVPVVFDGECLHHLMLPPLFNEACYVFTRHEKAVIKKRGER